MFLPFLQVHLCFAKSQVKSSRPPSPMPPLSLLSAPYLRPTWLPSVAVSDSNPHEIFYAVMIRYVLL